MKITKTIALVASLVALSVSSITVAGPYTNNLTKCLVDHTTKQDRSIFVKWVFSAMSLHADLAQYRNISEQQQQEIEKDVGGVFNRLLTVDCMAEVKEAATKEPLEFKQSFMIMGETAMSDLLSDPAVQKAFTSIATYIDISKLMTK